MARQNTRENSPESYLRCFTRALPFILVVSFFITWLHSVGSLSFIEHLTLDEMVRSRPISLDDVVFVLVDNADYKNIFGAQSPLDPGKVKKLIDAVCAGEPKTVLVDFNTDDGRFTKITKRNWGNTKVFWSRGGRGSATASDVLILDRVLGIDDPKDLHWGVANLPTDPYDGNIRYYYRHFRVQNPETKQVSYAPSLYWAVVQFHRGASAGSPYDLEPKILPSVRGGKTYKRQSAGNVLTYFDSGNLSGWKSMVKGKICLVGGTYGLARDDFPTALGRIPGVVLQGDAIGAELALQGISSVSDIAVFAMQFLAGLLLVTLLWFLPRKWALLAFPATVLAIIAGLLVINSWWLYVWVDIFPVLAVVQLQHSFIARSIAKRLSATRGGASLENTNPGQERPPSGVSVSLPSMSPREQKLKIVCLTCGMEFDDPSVTICPNDQTTLSKVIDDDLVGTVFAQRYQVTEFLGQGGVCTVYRAKHQLMGNQVAIKVLRSHLQADKQSLMRFQQEAKATSMIPRHPNVMSVQDFGITAEGKAFMVMDFIQGVSLKEWLMERGPLNEDIAVELFMQMADGLATAHDAGILHRDLKPSNIMMVKSESRALTPKIVDFGLAKIASNDMGITQTGQVMGSPLYMSPEQCMGEPLDHRSDIYSFGCIMYECLAGRPPFVSTAILEVFRMHAESLPPRFERTDLPEWLLQVISVALAKRPSDRFASVAELKAALISKGTERHAAQSVVLTMEHDMLEQP